MNIGVLALQGAFEEHIKMFQRLGVSCVELRQKSDLAKDYQGIILPGGESTVQGKLLHELDMFSTLKSQIEDGVPVLATCAGLILLAEQISNDAQGYLQTLPITVKRNAYGRQLGSFFQKDFLEGIGTFPMKFIRAPYIEVLDPHSTAKEPIQVLAMINEHIVGVRYQNQIGLSFHPELTEDIRLHEMFLNLIKPRERL